MNMKEKVEMIKMIITHQGLNPEEQVSMVARLFCAPESIVDSELNGAKVYPAKSGKGFTIQLRSIKTRYWVPMKGGSVGPLGKFKPGKKTEDTSTEDEA